MYVYEFGTDCGIPTNDGRVYIAYLDSTPYYHKTPNGHNPFRTIVSAYCHYASSLGFQHAHLWSATPKNPDGTVDYNASYIFYTGPCDKVRTEDELAKFYKNAFESFEYRLVDYEVVPTDKLALFPGDIKCRWVEGEECLQALTEANIFEVDLTSSPWYAQYYEDIVVLHNPHKRILERDHLQMNCNFTNRRAAYAYTAKILQDHQGTYVCNRGANSFGCPVVSIPIAFGPGSVDLELRNTVSSWLSWGLCLYGVHHASCLSLDSSVVTKKRGNCAGRWTSLVDYLEYELRTQNRGELGSINVYLANSTEYAVAMHQNTQARCLERTLLFTQRTCSSQQGGHCEPGTEILFFGLHVFEFGDDCGLPASGRVHISWIGETPYFQRQSFQDNMQAFPEPGIPVQRKRTRVDDPRGTIISAYLKYAGALGFTSAHLRCTPQQANLFTSSLNRAGLDSIIMVQPTDILVDLRQSEWFGGFFEDVQPLNNWQLVRGLQSLEYTGPASAYDATHHILSQIQGRSWRNSCQIANPNWFCSLASQTRSFAAAGA